MFYNIGHLKAHRVGKLQMPERDGDRRQIFYSAIPK